MNVEFHIFIFNFKPFLSYFCRKLSAMAEWFEDWFNTNYYHMLYEHRNDEEAQVFIKKLVQEISIPQKSRILDLACGKGRHSRFLNTLGYNVVGVDLSEESITCAKAHENEGLFFECRDMRKPIELGEFDLVCNLFTSFGYFETQSDNLTVLNAIRPSLKPNGILVIDFLNAEKVKAELIAEQTIIKCGISFHIQRKIEHERIVKTINFTDCSKDYTYQEKVQLLTLKDFEELFQKSGFKILSVFGDYNLGKFAPKNSERLLLIAQKI